MGAKSFLGFVASAITDTRYTMHMKDMPEAPPVAAGDAGWLLLVIRGGCMLAVARIAWSLASPAGGSRWRI